MSEHVKKNQKTQKNPMRIRRNYAFFIFALIWI